MRFLSLIFWKSWNSLGFKKLVPQSESRNRITNSEITKCGDPLHYVHRKVFLIHELETFQAWMTMTKQVFRRMPNEAFFQTILKFWANCADELTKFWSIWGFFYKKPPWSFCSQKTCIITWPPRIEVADKVLVLGPLMTKELKSNLSCKKYENIYG